MKPLSLNRDEWLGINPEYRAIVNRTPHAFVYDENAKRLVLTPIDITELPTTKHTRAAELLPA